DAALCAYAGAVGAHAALDWSATPPTIFDLTGATPVADALTAQSAPVLLASLLESKERSQVMAGNEVRS
ncbi:MAG: hypothetical protein WAU00_11530, partial [Caldilinea sp.]